MQQGFLASLFDLDFNSFITTKLIKFIYGLALLGNALFALSIVAAGFSEGFLMGLGALLIAAPLVFVFMTMLARVWMELVIVLFRTAEHMRETADNTRRMAHQDAAGV